MLIEKEIRQKTSFRNEYHRAAVNLIYTGKWLIYKHAKLFEQYHLSLQQYNVLRILRGRYPATATIKYIKKRMLDKMSDASRIVDVLVKRELISRVQNVKDRRKVDILILQNGIDVLNKIESFNSKMDNFLASLDTTEVKQLNQLLDKLRN